MTARTVEQMDRDRIPMGERTKEEQDATIRAAMLCVKAHFENPAVAAGIRAALAPTPTED